MSWRIGAVVACVAALGCATLPTSNFRSERTVPWPRRARDARGLVELRGQVHCHSRWSHDSKGTLAEIATAARTTGTDFVVMTDHQTPESVARGFRGIYGDTLFLVGAEISVGRGSLLAFPLRQFLPSQGRPAALVERAHAQGALVFVAHPEKWEHWDLPGLDGMEAFNLHAQAVAASKLALIAASLFGTPALLLGALTARPADNLARAQQLWASRRFPVIAGGDAHNNLQMFGHLGGVLVRYEQVFRTVSTHVLATELSEEAVVAALRAGRAWLAFELCGDADGFTFAARGGGSEAVVGEELRFVPGIRLRVQVPARARITLWRDGVAVHSAIGRELEQAVDAAGAWWVEVERDGAPWILSNPIYVR